MQAVGPAEALLAVERAINAAADALPRTRPDGTRYWTDQRRFDAVIALVTGAAGAAVGGSVGEPAGGGERARSGGRDVGVVLPADTFFGTGELADEPGELRGLGPAEPLDAETARDLAGRDVAAGGRLVAMLADRNGTLTRLVRLGQEPAGGWTRATLEAAVRAALPTLPSLRVDRYTPSPAIVEHAQTMYARCTFYGCARASSRSDLDHDTPWPRGPTAVWNLNPKCRRHHERKTRRHLHTTMAADGTVTWRMLTGVVVTTRPEPLPGHWEQ